MRRELTDAEIDDILERFDQTEPKLQRRIIARFIEDRELLLMACKKATESPGKDWLLAQLELADTIEQVEQR